MARRGAGPFAEDACNRPHSRLARGCARGRRGGTSASPRFAAVRRQRRTEHDGFGLRTALHGRRERVHETWAAADELLVEIRNEVPLAGSACGMGGLHALSEYSRLREPIARSCGRACPDLPTNGNLVVLVCPAFAAKPRPEVRARARGLRGVSEGRSACRRDIRGPDAAERGAPRHQRGNARRWDGAVRASSLLERRACALARAGACGRAQRDIGGCRLVVRARQARRAAAREPGRCAMRAVLCRELCRGSS